MSKVMRKKNEYLHGFGVHLLAEPVRLVEKVNPNWLEKDLRLLESVGDLADGMSSVPTWTNSPQDDLTL